MIEQANKENYDAKGNASHYNATRIGSMFLFERVYGTQALMTFCEMNALKYRLRLGHKEQPLDQELKKAKWYEEYAAKLFPIIGTDQEIIIDNTLSLIHI